MCQGNVPFAPTQPGDALRESESAFSRRAVIVHRRCWRINLPSSFPFLSSPACESRLLTPRKPSGEAHEELAVGRIHLANVT